MNTKTQNPLSTFKKSVISIVVLSAVTGGLVLLEQYRSNQSKVNFSEHLSRYSVPDQSEATFVDMNAVTEKHFFNNIEDNSLLTTEPEQLAKIAEENLINDVSVDKQNQDISIDQQFEKVEALLSNERQFIAGTDTNQSTSSEAMITDVNDSATVLFGLSSSVISPQYKLALVDLASQIKGQNASNNNAKNDLENSLHSQVQNSDLEKANQWQIVGHTDKSGRAVYNLSLAKKRAQNVALFLIEQGVDENQLTLVTMGEHEANTLTNSTYNKGLRKVEVKPYDPSLTVLAMKVKDNYIKQEQREKNKQIADAKILEEQQILAEKKGLELQNVSAEFVNEMGESEDTLQVNSSIVSKGNGSVYSDIQTGKIEELDPLLMSNEKALTDEVIVNDKDAEVTNISDDNVTSSVSPWTKESLGYSVQNSDEVLNVMINNKSNYAL